MNKIRVGVLFGSRSVEHEVSIVTAMQVFAFIDRDKYEVVPIYIDKQGNWNLGENLDKLESYKNLELLKNKKLEKYRVPEVGQKYMTSEKNGLLGSKSVNVDIMFPAVHGTYGEDGTLQGLLEMAGMPYVGCGVTASAVGMDKVIQKAVYEKVGLPVVKYVWFFNWEWLDKKEELIRKIEKELGYPVCVKPANLGSSVGINIAKNKEELVGAIEVASEFDNKLLIEEGLVGIDEINVSVLGNEKLEVSVCEQPVKNKTVLSYEDKYIGGAKTKGMASLSRLVPAPIKPELAKAIQEAAKTAFRVIGGEGMARVDFLVDIKKNKFYINEVNTIPGSLAYYLWEQSGYTFTQLLDKLIDLGFERYERRKNKLYTIDTRILQGAATGNKG